MRIRFAIVLLISFIGSAHSQDDPNICPSDCSVNPNMQPEDCGGSDGHSPGPDKYSLTPCEGMGGYCASEKCCCLDFVTSTVPTTVTTPTTPVLLSSEIDMTYILERDSKCATPSKLRKI
ncbi:hypothetical protein DdX_22338 [Ditylenchus destructor]|uniref:Uncharacterized protein n=1 Tax=Ditylenchus destructor TaxID=166010 RepID=A0AAD4QUS5_9BILA|nr:hypothetical protein DdX_22338 [Ditylenchus destructor]